MFKYMDWFGLSVTLFALSSIAFLFYVIVESANRREQRTHECESKGGTYISSEGVCIQMKSIPLKGD